MLKKTIPPGTIKVNLMEMGKDTLVTHVIQAPNS